MVLVRDSSAWLGIVVVLARDSFAWLGILVVLATVKWNDVTESLIV